MPSVRISFAAGLSCVLVIATTLGASAQGPNDPVWMHRFEIGLVVLTALKAEQTYMAAGASATRTLVTTLAKCGDQLTASCQSIIGKEPDPALYAQDPEMAKHLYTISRLTVSVAAINFDDMFKKQGVAATMKFVGKVAACSHHPFKDVEYEIAGRYFDASAERGLARLAQCGRDAG